MQKQADFSTAVDIEANGYILNCKYLQNTFKIYVSTLLMYITVKPDYIEIGSFLSSLLYTLIIDFKLLIGRVYIGDDTGVLTINDNKWSCHVKNITGEAFLVPADRASYVSEDTSTKEEPLNGDL